MKHRGRQWAYRRWGVAAGLLCALAAVLLSRTDAGERLELRTQDLCFVLRGPRATSAHIVIAAIADSTLEAWPEPFVRWGPHFAAAIRNARDLGASWIGLDIIQAAAPDADPDSARQNADSVHQFALALVGGRVVLADTLTGQHPLPELLYAQPQQTKNLGFIDQPRDLDGIARHAAVFEKASLLPSLPAVLALRLRGRSPDDAQALRELAGAPASEAEDGMITIWINYAGPPARQDWPHVFRTSRPERAHPFPVVSLEGLAAGTLNDTERTQIRDAVLLIGPTFAGSNDVVPGPGGRTYNGVEVHAHALATLLDRRPLRRSTPAREAIVTAALGVITAGLVAFLPLGRGLLVAATLAGAWCLASQAAFSFDRLLPTAGPVLAIGVAWVGHSSVRAVEEARRRRWIQGVFGRYVSREIVEYLFQHPAHLALGGVECEASVLFVDIRGFTTHAERRSPSAVLDEVNAFFGEVVPVIDRCEGLVLQYTGDGLLAVFGAPRVVENHAQAAVDAAIGIVGVSRRISAARRAAGGLPLRIGCSVHSGLVVCGNVGGEARSQYSVMGDTTNVAARLEELNKAPELNREFPSEVVMSAATYARLNEPPPARGPFEFEIRGREGRISVYQVRIENE